MKQAPEDPLAEIDRFAYLEDLAILHGARFAGVLPARAETLVRRALRERRVQSAQRFGCSLDWSGSAQRFKSRATWDQISEKS
jgi:hypothetical protein